MKVEWSTRAVADLKSISEYIEQDRGIEAANRVARSLYDAVQGLRSMPHRGRPGRLAGTRELIVTGSPYFVVYQASTGRVVVLNILHGAQRWP